MAPAKVVNCFKRNTKYARNSLSHNTFVPSMTEDCITQVSEEIAGRAIENLLQEFSRTKSLALGALLKLDDFLLNPQVRTCSRIVRGTSRNND